MKKKEPYYLPQGLIYVPFSKKESDLKKALANLSDKMFNYNGDNHSVFYHEDEISKKKLSKITVEEFRYKYQGHLIISSHCDYGESPKMKPFTGMGKKELLTASEVLARVKEDIPKGIVQNITVITLLACYGAGLDAAHAKAFKECTGKKSVSFLEMMHNDISYAEYPAFEKLREINGFKRAIAITGNSLIFVRGMKDPEDCRWDVDSEYEDNTIDHLETMGANSFAFFDDFGNM